MGRPLVEVNAVSRVFVSGAARHTALDDISFQVGEREFVALLGPSGCGKSTLLRLIADIIPPTSGRLTVAGGSPEAARRAGLFGFVFQESVLFPWLTALANVELPLKVGRPARPRNPRELLELVGLGDFAAYYPHQLSGGMRQRVALARALVTDPQLLLMDEPFAALDEITREAMGNWLLTVWEQTGKTVLFVTHSVPEAVYLADRVVVLSPAPGRIEAVLPIVLPRPRQPDLKDTLPFFEQAAAVRRRLSVREDVTAGLV
jgi:NitT/TauT family transport system ATP-binding protein